MGAYLLHDGSADMAMLLQHIAIPHGVEPAGGKHTVTINWGVDSLSAGRGIVINPAEYVKRSKCRKTVERLLKMNGIHYTGGFVDAESPSVTLESGRRELSSKMYDYMVPVFHLRALALFSRLTNQWFIQRTFGEAIGEYEEMELNLANKRIRAAVREAVKAVYALGLDYAVVHVLADQECRVTVRDVQTPPRLNARTGELFGKAINRFDLELRQELSRKANIMLGADPEFVLRTPEGKIKMPGVYVGKKGTVGCDSILLRDRRPVYPIVELRPEPGETPAWLFRNLYETIRSAVERIPDPELQWLAGGMPVNGLALGGHVHLSGIWLNSHLLRVLDNYLALPVMMLEGEQTKKRRPRYGFLGDFRRQSHGGFEYRTLPSWLISPRIAYAVFALTYVIAQHYWELRLRKLDDPLTRWRYYHGDKQALLEPVAEIWAEIRRLPAYGQYRAVLDDLEHRIFAMFTWDESRDIRAAWKVEGFQSFKKHALRT